ELDALIAQAKERKATLKKRAPIAAIRKRIVDFATAEGYSVEELFGTTGMRGTRAAKGPKAAKAAGRAGRKLGKVPPKYRNPANAKEVWTGRGRQPRWMAEQVAKGKKPEDFLIKKK